MTEMIPALPFAISMLAGMLICLEAGRRLGVRRLADDPQALSGTGAVDGATFALYGLLVAFTFSGAPGRLDARRQLVAQEANAIGTAYLRLDLLAAESQPSLREEFRRYVDSRIETYRLLPDVAAAQAELTKSTIQQSEIWRHAVAATRLPDAHPAAARLLLPALNDMIDIVTTRTTAMQIHPPAIIFALLFLLALVCSLLAGYGMAGTRRRSPLHIMAFSAVAVIAVFVVLEIEYPRMGFIRYTANDQVLVDLRLGMK